MFSDQHTEQVGTLYNAAQKDCECCFGFGRIIVGNQILVCPLCFEPEAGAGPSIAPSNDIGMVDSIACAVGDCWRIVLGRV